MGIVEDIGVGPVFLDTCLFIYFIEENSEFIFPTAQIFEAFDAGRLMAFTSGLTLMEALVVPLQDNDVKLANHYHQFLSESHGLTLLDLNQNILCAAAL